jgi:iron complex outermembrane receptor protein
MKQNLVKSVLVLATAIGTGLPVPAFAQTSGGGQGGNELQEIVVTARRKEERLQTVPISITVFNQQKLTNLNVSNVTDLATYTPSLSTDGTFGPDNTSFAIRGFAQAGNTTPSVGVYFADVVVPRGLDSSGVPAGSGAGPGLFFDLQNVQVLKGPQGTLFGRNTTGGAILFVPQKPTAAYEGYIESSFGNYDLVQIQAVLNIPVNDRIRFRVGVDHKSRGGYAISTTGIGPSDFDNIDYVTARASLVVDVTDDLDNYTVGYYTKSDSNGDIPRMFACNPKSGLSFFCAPQLAADKAKGEGFFNVDNDHPQAASRLREWQMVNTTTWHATDDLILKNIASYGQLRDWLYEDLFGTHWLVPPLLTHDGPQPFSFTNVTPAPGLASGREATFTEEAQLQGNALDGRLSYQGGLYMEMNTPIGDSGAAGPTVLSCTDASQFHCTDYLGMFTHSLIGSIEYQDIAIRRHDYAIYTQESYSLTDELKLTAGYRYTWDVSRSTSKLVNYYFPQPNTPLGFCTSNSSVRATSPDVCTQHFEEESHAPTWLIDLDYKPIDDIMVYGKYARGYRSGSVIPLAPNGYNSFRPEKVDTYEVGVKSAFRGEVPAIFNVAAFYNDFTNQQLLIGFQSSTNSVTPTAGIVNAGKSRIYGAEIEASVKPFPGFTLDGSYAYLNAKLVSIDVPAPTPGSAYDVLVPTSRAGSVLPLTPRNKFTLTGTYVLPLPQDIGKVSVGLTYSYTGTEFVTQASPFGFIQDVNLVNLNLAWESIAGRPFDLEFFMTNLTDEQYFTSIAGLYDSVGFESGRLGEPRMYGFRLRARFGGG